MLTDRYDKEQAELTEKIEQYEREGHAEHDQDVYKRQGVCSSANKCEPYECRC